MRRRWQPASAFSRAGRSGGRPALQLPRPSSPAEVQQAAQRSVRAPQELEIPVAVLFPPIRGGLEGVRPSSSHISRLATAARHIPPLPTALRRSRNFPPRYRPPAGEEVRRATGPPAPMSINVYRKHGRGIQCSGNFSARRRQMFRNASRKIAPLILEVPALRSGKMIGNSAIRQPCR